MDQPFRPTVTIYGDTDPRQAESATSLAIRACREILLPGIKVSDSVAYSMLDEYFRIADVEDMPPGAWTLFQLTKLAGRRESDLIDDTEYLEERAAERLGIVPKKQVDVGAIEDARDLISEQYITMQRRHRAGCESLGDLINRLDALVDTLGDDNARQSIEGA